MCSIIKDSKNFTIHKNYIYPSLIRKWQKRRSKFHQDGHLIFMEDWCILQLELGESKEWCIIQLELAESGFKDVNEDRHENYLNRTSIETFSLKCVNTTVCYNIWLGGHWIFLLTACDNWSWFCGIFNKMTNLKSSR